MSEQVGESDFLTTIKELMRLTREGVLDWSVDHSPGPFFEPSGSQYPDRLPTYRAEYENLKFTIEDAAPYALQKIIPNTSISKERRKINPGSRYRLVIRDKDDSSTVSSTPMKPIDDLVSIIEKKPKKEKLKDINDKLSNV
jgi:hypothetical protein